MNRIVRTLATAGICAMLSIPAQADAQQITLSLSGIVDQGRDDLNLFFGDPGEVIFLSGQAYSMSLTVDAADLNLIHSTLSFADYSGASVALTGALTMNGKTLTWTTDMATAGVRLELEPEIISPEDRQAVSMRSTASRQPGTGNRDIAARHEVTTFFWPLLGSTDLNQEITFPEFMRDAVASSHFEATGMGTVPNLTTWFDARATSATWTLSPVPEPTQYGMLAAGLMTLALARRRLRCAVPDMNEKGACS